MREESLNDRILRVLAAAGRPMAAIEIRRALPDAVEASEVASRLNWLVEAGKVITNDGPRIAATGSIE